MLDSEGTMVDKAIVPELDYNQPELLHNSHWKARFIKIVSG